MFKQKLKKCNSEFNENYWALKTKKTISDDMEQTAAIQQI